MNKLIKYLTITALIVLILAGLTWRYNTFIDTQISTAEPAASTVLNQHNYAKDIIKPKQGQPIKKFYLTAQESKLEIKKGVTIPVWTYNGSVPGKEIRVTQGDFVQVELKNTLKEPVTIHWHGYPVVSGMDGVPGLNQEAVKPGETFIYQFSADVAGTYWYHSHQESSKQVDKGLYGALIVEPKEYKKPDKEFVLVLDEWMEQTQQMESMTGMKGHSEGNQGQTSPDEMREEEEMAVMYNVYTVNGKSGELITPMELKKGENVRIRLINAGYRSHGIHIPAQKIKVVSTDGQNIENPQEFSDQIIMIAPGERYDIEFSVNSDNNFYIDFHDQNRYNSQIRIPVKVLEGNSEWFEEKENEKIPFFDFNNYGEKQQEKFTLDEKYDVEDTLELGTKQVHNTLQYTINEKTYEEALPLMLKTGQRVKLTYINNSKVDHPMHLHGHFFQVLAKNNKPVTGAVIMKDTLLIKPGEKYTIAFEANNTGYWVQHCHELHHASAGMMQKIEYIDFKSEYKPNSNSDINKPE